VDIIKFWFARITSWTFKAYRDRIHPDDIEVLLDNALANTIKTGDDLLIITDL
jgi:hypothetical protein